MVQQPAAKTFGRYSLIRKIAQGGMAEIFLAKFRGDSGFEKKVIIKRILPRFSQNHEFIKMLVHEAKLAVQLQHANIVQIYDLGRIKDSYFISMEYIKGKDLRTVLNRCKAGNRYLDEVLAVFVTREMCKGLEYAHSFVNESGEPLNLVHRDISPPNVLLSLEGEVKIIDFGIAKATAKATDTQAGVFKGKFAYMAPEQASGLPVDRRIDIFATGLILYEMLTNVKLLDAETDIQTLERAKNIDSVPLPELKARNLHPDLEKILRKALAQDREKRYQTAGEMARELSIYLNTRFPAFVSDEMGSFMREIFNLGRQGGGNAFHEDEGREATDSDFFITLPELELEDEQPAAPSPRASIGPSLSPARPARNLMETREGEEDWLAEALRTDFEATAIGAPGGGGWVSEIASDYETSESGTMRPIVTQPTRRRFEDSVEKTIPGEPSPQQEVTSSVRVEGGGRSYALQMMGGFIGVFVVLLAALLVTPARYAAQLPDHVVNLRTGVLSALGVRVESILVVTTDPADTEVYVDGSLRGVGGPMEIPLLVDRQYSITGRREGYEPAVRMVTLTSETPRTELALKLLQLRLPVEPGKVEVVSDPAGARIFVDNVEQVGKLTPATIEGLPLDRKVKLRVEKYRYQVVEIEATPSEESPPRLEVALKPGPIGLKVMTSPEAAEVYLDDRKWGDTPLELLLEPSKTYDLKLVKKGYESYTERLSTPVGEDINLRVSLSRAGAGPSSGKVERVRPPASAAAAPAQASQPEAPKAPPAQEAPRKAAAAPQAALVGVRVLSKATDVEIIVNGANVGTMRADNLSLVPGKYIVRLRSKSLSRDQQVSREIRQEDIGTQVKWEFEVL